MKTIWSKPPQCVAWIPDLQHQLFSTVDLFLLYCTTANVDVVSCCCFSLHSHGIDCLHFFFFSSQSEVSIKIHVLSPITWPSVRTPTSEIFLTTHNICSQIRNARLPNKHVQHRDARKAEIIFSCSCAGWRNNIISPTSPHHPSLKNECTRICRWSHSCEYSRRCLS